MTQGDRKATFRTLFLNPPATSCIYGGAWSRFSARREFRPTWHPIRLAEAASLVANSKLIDAPADDLNLEEVLQRAKGFELCVFQSSRGSSANDARVAEALKRAHPAMRIGLLGGDAALPAEEALADCPAADFVADCAAALHLAACGRPYADVPGLAFRRDGEVRRNPPAPAPDREPEALGVLEVYRRDLTIDNYRVSFLKRPYLSLPADGADAAARLARAREMFPEVKEFFLEGDLLADSGGAPELARDLGRLGIPWSCRARPNVPPETLRLLKASGLRLLVAAYDSGSQRVLSRSGSPLRLEEARDFTKTCRELGILVHGTFVLGLQGETRETMQESLRFACELGIETISVSPAPLQQRPLLSAEELEAAVRRFYVRFFARPVPILRMLAAMGADPDERRRRLLQLRDLAGALRSRWARPGAPDAPPGGAVGGEAASDGAAA